MPKILVVDDSSFQRRKVIKFLRNDGFETVEAECVSKALELLESEQPDLVLLDLLMPDITGFGFLEAIKEKNCDVPVVVLSADVQESQQKRCFDLGAKAFLNKPPKADIVIQTIRNFHKSDESDGSDGPVETDDSEVSQIKQELTDYQKDALKELLNIGVGKGASVLNEMLETYVELFVPTIEVLNYDEYKKRLLEAGEDNHSSVRLRFDGDFSGSASLVFLTTSATKLVSLLAEQEEIEEEFDSIMSGTLMEVGNIVINGVMGSFSNALESTIDYAVPVYENDKLVNIITTQQDGPHIYYIIANTGFKINEHQINGDMIIVFKVASFKALLEAL